MDAAGVGGVGKGNPEPIGLGDLNETTAPPWRILEKEMRLTEDGLAREERGLQPAGMVHGPLVVCIFDVEDRDERTCIEQRCHDRPYPFM